MLGTPASRHREYRGRGWRLRPVNLLRRRARCARIRRRLTRTGGPGMAEAGGSAGGRAGRWSAKEIIQGKPIRRPTHPFFVIFPISFWAGALGVDVLGRLSLLGAPLAATYAVIAGLIGAVFAITTGLV